ncbi:hypothetical protein [Streptomyces cyaneofuscatus]|uniref:hypothetical protein n=1 Tax=Streptomyces cyaneofuscatus TaxID=66883 RepID=UPI00365DD7DA
MTLLPGNEGIAQAVADRVGKLLGTVGGGGMARAELLATGAVVEAKRARAGRTLFLPGNWTEIGAPHLPLETAKLATHVVCPLYGNRILAPFVRVLPTAPLHEMFAEAWERR